jgi:hypothetical protein
MATLEHIKDFWERIETDQRLEAFLRRIGFIRPDSPEENNPIRKSLSSTRKGFINLLRFGTRKDPVEESKNQLLN